METFNIEVTETLSRIIEIEANSEEDAFSLVRAKYKSGDIVLDWSDYVDTNFLKL